MSDTDPLVERYNSALALCNRCIANGPDVAIAAALVQAAALRLAARDVAEALDRLTRQMSDVAENVRSDHPLMGETLAVIGDPLQEIAEAMTDMAKAKDPA